MTRSKQILFEENTFITRKYIGGITGSFPDKLKLLSEFNIVPPTLLGRYNKERNAMEHKYTKPSHEIVLGSIELCDLIFLASERFLLKAPRRLRIKFKDDQRDLIALLEPGGTKIQFFEILGANEVNDANGKILFR